MPKKYRTRQEAMEAVLMGAFDTSGVKTAKQIQEERAAKRAAQEEANRKKYVQLDNVLTNNRDQVRIRKLQAIIDNPAAAPQEKESARKSIERIKSKGGGK
jgi:hypothetical protein